MVMTEVLEKFSHTETSSPGPIYLLGNHHHMSLSRLVHELSGVTQPPFVQSVVCVREFAKAPEHENFGSLGSCGQLLAVHFK